jgi:hypothetical protein
MKRQETMVPYNLVLPPSMKTAVEDAAWQKRLSASAWVREAIQEKLNREQRADV